MAWTVAIGVDTHKDAHVAVALDVLGVELDHCAVEATLAGYKRRLRWATGLGCPAFAVEGCGSYGAGLARFLQAAGHNVCECERPRRSDRRRGKNDLIDAAIAARRLLSGDGLSVPRGGDQREQLRLLLLERRGAVHARTAALNQLHAVVVTAPDALRQRLTPLSTRRLAKTAATLRSPAAVCEVLRRIGRRAEALSAEIAEIDRSLSILVAQLAPCLLAECGVGAVCAAQLLVSNGEQQRTASTGAETANSTGPCT